MKKIIVILFIISFAIPASAFNPLIVCSGVQSTAGGGSNPEDAVTFWLTFEANDTTGDYNIDGTNDCSNGDTSIVYGSAIIDSASTLSGTYCMDVPTTYDTMSATISSGDIVNQAQGRVGFWLRKYTAWGSSADGMVNFREDGDNNMLIRFVAGGDIDVRWEEATVERVVLASSGENMAVDTDYFIEVGWHVANDDLTIWVNDTQVADSNTDLNAEIVWTSAFFGDDGGSDDYYMDNIIIGNLYNQSLYSLRNLNAPSCDGTGVACND